MKKIEFEKMLKEVGASRVLGRHYNDLVNLTRKQVDQCIKLKNEVK